jgi:hypothetical protein
MATLSADGTVAEVPKPPSSTIGVTYIGFTTTRTGIAVIDGALWRSEDAGQTWSRVDVVTSR